VTQPAGLPAPLRRHLATLAARVRGLCLLRGVSAVLLFLALGLLLIFAADFFWTLSRPVLRAAAAVLAVGTLGLGCFCLVRPLCRPPGAHALAALIERRYPQLRERLTSSVALAERRDLSNGAPTLVELLFAETVTRTQGLDVAAAVPARPSLWLAAMALAALLVAVTPAVLWADASHDLGTRLLVCWFTADAADPVSSKPTAAAAAELPRLDAAASAITITPPPYAGPREHPPQTLPPLTPRTALQTGAAAFDLRFTRPVAAAHLELTHLATAKRQRHPLQLSDDGKRGRLDLALPGVGAFAVALLLDDADAAPLPPLTVLADTPPVFARPPDLPDVTVTGAAAWPGGRGDTPFHELLAVRQTRQVPPEDKLPLRLSVLDDVGVTQVRLEYRVNHGPVCQEVLWPGAPANTAGRRSAHVDRQFQLGGKVKDGDVVAFRLAAVDNRRTADLGPQTAYWPAPEGGRERWLLLHVRQAAAPLARQEIQEQHDDVKERLADIQKALRAERDQLAKVEQDLKDKPAFGPVAAEQVTELWQQNRQITARLRELEKLAAARPGLRDLADRARQLAAGQLHRSEQALGDARQPEADAVRRAQLLHAADLELAQAQKLLDDLNQDNDRLAQDRLDQQELGKLADRQAELARQAAGLMGKNAKDDPERQKMLEALRIEQEKLAAAVKRLTEQSPRLQAALKAAQARQAQELATQAQNLAEKQQKLTMEADKTFKHLVETKFADLVRQQQELAEKAARLGQDTKAALARAEKMPADTAAARQAAEALREANAAAAVEKQGQAVKDLERLAGDLDAALAKAADKEAVKAQQKQARQLADAQKELQDAVRKLARLPDPEQEKAAAALAQKQADVAAETAGLMKGLEQLGKDTKEGSGTGGASEAATKAAEDADRAAAAMKLSQAQTKDGNLGKAQAEREQAVKMLGKAAAEARDVANQLTPTERDPDGTMKVEAGQALRQGRDESGQAADQLAQGQVPGARDAMQRAAQALQRAADRSEQQLADSKESSEFGAAPGGLPSLERFGKDYRKYAGKSWGELPGELQTRLLQDLRARYGADYAELIQRYFEQLAAPARKGE
jgi:hypothetical protein